MARYDTARLVKAALFALAGGTLVAIVNPARSIERKADSGVAAIDREAVQVVALVERQPSPAPRTPVSSPQ